MSVKLVEEEIKRFLESPEPEVICLMGKWGVGKTFAWNQYLNSAASGNTIALKRYAYATLFGQNSLEGLKYAIFENTVRVEHLGDEQSVDTLGDAIGALEKWARKATTLIGSVPKVQEYSALLSRSFFLAVRNQIVCIDDLERVGDGLSTKDVMGLISFLKEQRKCKVVVLLNKEELESEASKVFESQLEKVVDVEMFFEPTPSEAATIGVDLSTSFHDKFSQSCKALGIVNIRVIRKIQRLLKRLEQLLAGHDKRVFEAALPSIVLFGWAIYQPKSAPTLDYIKGFNAYSHMFLDKGKTESDEEKNWRLTVSAAPFSHFDEFDQVLLQSVQQGYFNPEVIEKAADEFDKRLEHQDKDSSFGGAWGMYHGSFETNDDEVLDAMYASFKGGVQTISPQNLDGTLGLFRKMGRNKQADEMIDTYMKERQEGKDFYDPQRSFFLSLKDSKLKQAFADKLETFKDTRDPKEILIKIAQSSGWNPEDITTLANISPDEYYYLFKGSTGDDLRVIVSQSLKFRNYAPPDPNYETISANAEEALKRIAKESPMNLERVMSYGITIDEEEN